MDRMTKRKCVRADPMVAGHMAWRSVMNHSDSDDMPLRNPLNNEVNILGRRWITEYASCFGGAENNACRLFGGQCATMLDGFFLEFSVCLFIGLLAFPCILRPLAIQLDALPSSAFTVRTSRPVWCIPFPWRRTGNATVE
ncbi:unnamed protein product [Dicrocoelium dendriticum]|nr:unnamed protein product [Dicrocoelium dendriticum]